MELIQNITLCLGNLSSLSQVEGLRLPDRFPGLRNLTLLFPSDYGGYHVHITDGEIVNCWEGFTINMIEEFKSFSHRHGWELQMVDGDGNLLTPRCGELASDAALAELNGPLHFIYS